MEAGEEKNVARQMQNQLLSMLEQTLRRMMRAKKKKNARATCIKNARWEDVVGNVRVIVWVSVGVCEKREKRNARRVCVEIAETFRSRAGDGPGVWWW